MAASFTFDGLNKLILIDLGTIEFDVEELYSRWMDWVSIQDNIKFAQAIRYVGGDAVSDTKNLGITFFLINGWRIRPQEANHTLRVNGNLYTDPSGFSPFVGTVGAYNVMIEMTVSSLVDSSLAQITEIEQSAFNGRVAIDSINGITTTVYPAGTLTNPVQNIATAKNVASARGFDTFFIVGNLTIGATDDISTLHFYGQGASLNVARTTVTYTTGCITTNAHWHDCKITGYQGGESFYHNCTISALDNAHCYYESCGLLDGTSAGYTIRQTTVSTGHASYFKNCYSDEGVAIIDRNSTKLNMRFDGFTGNIKFINQNRPYVSASDKSGNIDIHINGGVVTVDSTCTYGRITITGTGTLINQSAGTEVDASGFTPEQFKIQTLHIESLRETHQGFGERFFCDWVSGSDLAPGTSPSSPLKTIAAAINKCVSGRGDVIFLIAPGAGAAIFDEHVVINKEDVHLRGPGRGVEIKPSVGGSPTISITANNCSMAGFVARSATNSNDDVIVVSGKFSKLIKLYVVGSGQGIGTGSGILYTHGDYHELLDVESEKCGRSGVLIKDLSGGTGNGSPREISIKGGIYYLNGKDGIEFEGSGVVGSSNRLNRILGANIHDNLGYGVRIDALTSGTVISDSTMIHNNTLGNTNDAGLNTYDGRLTTSNIATSVWTHAFASKLLTFAKYLGLK